ncbi:MAG: ROK family protein [Acidimicrobiales bacterium]|nr:ROK family protein [Acidimicrobiales bacterium]
MLTLLHQAGPIRRAEVTHRTGLNKSTVLSLVDELSELGLISESTAVSDGSRGRPSAIVQLNSENVVTVVSEIAVDFARIAVVGLGGIVMQSIDVDVNPRAVGPTATAQALGEAGVNLIVPGSAVVAAATAVHGVVSTEGHLTTAPNLDWRNLDLGQLARPFLPRDIPVFFGNDADLGALGEHRRGVARDVEGLLYLSAERGIGGGLIRGGELQQGIHGHATEVGHFVVRRAGSRCSCGSKGCLETEIGESALLRKAGRRSSAGRVVELAREGDSAAQRAVADVASWLGFAIGNLVNLLDPGMTVAGGFLSDIVELAGDTVRRESEAVALVTEAIDIRASALNRDAALVGAAELAFDHILQDPAAIALRSPIVRETA